LTHILVDFENVQPSAQDIALVRGDGLRLTIFRGPGQKKYSADVAEPWQPLGANVSFVRCAKAGRNAIDMHIALHIGKLIGELKSSSASAAARFIIVSKDTDYDPLLTHIRDVLGQVASRVSSIKSALEGRAAPRTAKALRTAPAATTAKKSTATKATAKKSSAKSVAKKAAAKTPALAQTTPAARAAREVRIN
ncbi:MAG: PIN domain-containing protein, partial [Burkholderiaceae bacterium]